jgi:hypothetical protein
MAIARHEFTHDSRIVVTCLTPLREGAVMADLVTRLKAFPDPKAWSFLLRRPLSPLPPKTPS